MKQYWQRYIYLPFLDVTFPDVESHFGQKKRSHYKNIAKVVLEHDENNINEF